MLSLSQIDYSFLSTWYAHLTFQFPSRMTAIRIGHTLDHNRLLPLYPSIVAAFVVGNTDGGVHLVQGRLLQRCTGRPTETWPYNTIQYNTMICNAHKVENRTSNLRRGRIRTQMDQHAMDRFVLGAVQTGRLASHQCLPSPVSHACSPLWLALPQYHCLPLLLPRLPWRWRMLHRWLAADVRDNAYQMLVIWAAHEHR